MEERQKKILIVDDEEDYLAIVQYHMTREGYQVDVAQSAEEALGRDVSCYDLFLLDVMMPGQSGFEMAVRLRQNRATASTPIIFLTAMDADENVVEGLKLGADDYIAKPFSAQVLKARVEAVLRRARKDQGASGDSRLIHEGIVVDTERMTLTIDGAEVETTRRELDLLTLFIKNPDRVFSREEILQKVWPDDAYVNSRTVDVTITRLRKKLGRYAECIHTRVGYGYSFKA